MAATAGAEGGVVKLISMEGVVFVVERAVARVSGTISNMLEGAWPRTG